MKNVLRILALALLLPFGAAHATTADEILQRYVQAVGGSEKLARIQTRSIEAKISVGWFSAKMKSRLARPNLYDAEASILGQGTGSGFDGTTGWTRKGSKVTIVEGKALKRQMRGQSLDWYTRFPQWYPTRRLLPDETIDGTPVQVIELTTETGEREIWRFDAATGLLKQVEGMKQEEGAEDPKAKPVKVVSTISDYREVDGILIAHKVTGLEGKREFTMELVSVVHNQPLTPPVRFPGTK